MDWSAKVDTTSYRALRLGFQPTLLNGSTQLTYLIKQVKLELAISIRKSSKIFIENSQPSFSKNNKFMKNKLGWIDPKYAPSSDALIAFS